MGARNSIVNTVNVKSDQCTTLVADPTTQVCFNHYSNSYLNGSNRL